MCEYTLENQYDWVRMLAATAMEKREEQYLN